MLWYNEDNKDLLNLDLFLLDWRQERGVPHHRPRGDVIAQASVGEETVIQFLFRVYTTTILI
jgi:hypothetical protein